jgi:ribosomal protein L24
MNAEFINKKIVVGDIVRITTKEAIGVIGKVTDIDSNNDGIEIEGLKATDLKQIDNPIEFDTALFPISDIKYIFKIKLEETKPIIN